MEKGKVYLVGAGPGDPGLLTVKGLWCIRHADVIIYDYLASNALLNEADENAELIYAGKRAGHHHMPQNEIQELLLEKAFEGKSVVRLKGGDPFIFGRGGEEALVLKMAEIPFEIVPGVSSAYSVPAYAGIPVTHRGMAAQVHFITGHEQPEESTVDYEVLAKSGGTLVFLMGIQRMAEIQSSLVKYGKDEATPAAVITNGTTGNQKVVTGTLGTIVNDAKMAGMHPPGILVVGQVAELSDILDWQREQPLRGKRILLTGTRDLVRKQHSSFLQAGAEPIDVSLIYTEPAKESALKEIIEEISDFSWIVFTSSRGVSLFFDTLKSYDIDYRQTDQLKFAVVGSGTAETLKDYGFLADYMPESYTSEALAQGLTMNVSSDEKIMIFRAKEGSQAINRCFDEKGLTYTDVPAYETRTDWRKKDILDRALKGVDYITFASGSAVRAFTEMAGEIENCPPILCIGPVTAGMAEEAGLKVFATAEEYTIDGLTDCLCQLNIKE
ncbi:MAG: uroporphyrinogen-III C-methyltransferase [Lachnospiraceae bacterium]|nr:uroporphyrinogen-III C-methyltransferase [Lachnospiraceae bacterium]